MKKKKKLSKKELAHYKKVLLGIREKIFSGVQHIKADSISSNENAIIGDRSDDADVAVENYDTEFHLGIAAKEEDLLHDIDLALKKIEDGTYGFCEKYETPIPEARLKVMPYARYSVKAQEEEEEEKKKLV